MGPLSVWLAHVPPERTQATGESSKKLYAAHQFEPERASKTVGGFELRDGDGPDERRGRPLGAGRRSSSSSRWCPSRPSPC